MAASEVGPRGRVVGVDRAPVEPPLENANVVAFIGDLADPAVAERILELLDGTADVLLSDAAPKLTGVRERDRALEEELLLGVDQVMGSLLRTGGSLLLKIFRDRKRKSWNEASASASRAPSR